MNYTQSIGDLVELHCMMKFIEYGYECSIPYGNGAKYDFIADVNGELLKIQCKSSTHPKKNGVVDEGPFVFSTSSQTTNTQKTVRHGYTEEQIDYFATYFQGKVYLIPVQECSSNNKTLRLTPPKNNQAYNAAEDYEFEKRISFSEELLKTKQDFENRIITKQQEKRYCLECNKEISQDSASGLCFNCWAKTIRKCERPTREELKQMIRTIPFVTIGRKYGVSDNAVRKWCKSENLPYTVKEIKSYNDIDWSNI